MTHFLTTACAVCFGDPSSLMSKGLVAGVLLLMGIIFSVLGVIAWTGFSWSRRAKRLGGKSF